MNAAGAPAPIGPYSPVVVHEGSAYLSGQIPLDPVSMQLVDGDITAQTERVLDNLQAVAESVGGELQHAVKLNVYLTDLADFAAVNACMAARLCPPYPARACVQVAALPQGACVEIDAVLALRHAR